MSKNHTRREILESIDLFPINNDYEEDKEDVYVKNRTTRSQRRKNAIRTRRHAKNISFILSKKADKEMREFSHNSVPSATLYERARAIPVYDIFVSVNECDDTELLLNAEYDAKIMKHATRRYKSYASRLVPWERRMNRIREDVDSAEDKTSKTPIEDETLEALFGFSSDIKDKQSYVNHTAKLASSNRPVLAKNIYLRTSSVPVIIETVSVPCINPSVNFRKSFLGMI